MSESYTYKVRDKSGNLVTGTLVADNERLVLERLREMGYTPARGRQGEEGPQLRDQPQGPEGQAQGSRDLLPAVRHHGQLRPADPARAVDPGRPDQQQGAREDPDARPQRRRAGLVACRWPWRSTRRSFNDLYVAMVKSGETGGSLDDVLLRLADMLEREVHLRSKIKSAMTYPVAVVALVVADHVGDAAVRRAAVQEHLHAARRHAAAADAGPARWSRTPSKKYWYIVHHR